jgi:hypothetical protein
MIVNADPGAISLPYAEVLISSAPVRQIVREQPPGAAASQNILNGVDDLTHRIESVATSWSLLGK